MCRCALTASLRATRGQPRKNQTDDIRMSNNARRYPPSVYPNRYTVGRYRAGTADSWSYPPVVRRSGCMAGRYVCGIVNRRRYLPAVRWSGCMAGQTGRWCHAGSVAVRLWCDGPVTRQADTSRTWQADPRHMPSPAGRHPLAASRSPCQQLLHQRGHTFAGVGIGQRNTACRSFRCEFAQCFQHHA